MAMTLAMGACGGASGDGDGDGDTTAEDGGDGDGDDPDRETVTHFFGELNLEPLEEITPCVSWTIGNEESLWIEQTDLYNQGMYHHSTWIAVPEEKYPGPDGFWDCNERGFDEVDAALSGTVLIAQSTQSLWETQRYGPEDAGVVVKIPPRHKLVAVNHVLNVSNRPITTGITMNIHLVHPKLVETVLVPFRLAYWDLAIPPAENGVPTESDFNAECRLEQAFDSNGLPIDTRVHYLLPHTHDLGKRFFVDIIGGERDGERIVDIQGFNAQGNGQSFFPPVDLAGAEGLRMTCGFANERDEVIEWGIGDQEMCEMLGMADSSLVMDFGVNNNEELEPIDGVRQFGGSCSGVGFFPNSRQSPPTEGERGGDLYVPELPPEDEELPEIPECINTDQSVEAEAPTTLSSVSETLFASCAWSSCHSGPSAAAGLDLEAEDLHTELLEHVSISDPGRPLVDPGNRDNSVLYRRVAYCDGETTEGQPLNHMPFGSPTLLEDALVNKLGAWIDDGAEND